MDEVKASCLRRSRLLIKLILILRIASTSDDPMTPQGAVDLVDTLGRDSQMGFVWDPYLQDYNAHDRSFSLPSDRCTSRSSTPQSTPSRAPPQQWSVPTFESQLPWRSSLDQRHAPPALKPDPLPPTERRRPLEVYSRALPRGKNILFFHHPNSKFCSEPSAIIRKYQGQRSVIERKQTSLERELTEYVKDLCNRELCVTKVNTMKGVMLSDFQHPPHILVQSYYIVLCANVDIHYAMNYILSAFCTGFDEVAVVTLLKQLTVFSDHNHDEDENYVYVIKAIWDRILHQSALKNAVLHNKNKNVASYSLKTLAVHHMCYDQGILSTFLKLLVQSMRTEQDITLTTYNCIVRRLLRISTRLVDETHRTMMTKIWPKVKYRLRYQTGKMKEDWARLMFQVCHKFEMTELTERVNDFWMTM